MSDCWDVDRLGGWASSAGEAWPLLVAYGISWYWGACRLGASGTEWYSGGFVETGRGAAEEKEENLSTTGKLQYDI